MNLAVDVWYQGTNACIGGILFRRWEDAEPAQVILSHLKDIKAYRSGQFYKRELPCILHLIDDYHLQPDCIVIDGYVYLDENARPGLGKHLWDALGGKTPIIGVAKSHYGSIPVETQLLRGSSHKPLFVTAAGMSLASAKDCVRRMHGAHRIPTLLRRVDQIGKGMQN